jgi:5-(carboxyamino)imidazole ribonucleotide synthase
MLGPLVEMSFDSALNLIDCTLMPARVTPTIEAQAQKIARKIVHELNYVGVMAVEMFLVGDELLVNELAPRPHNSGHGTIELCATDQFEEHLRAVCDKPLTPFDIKFSGATFNLLGREGFSGETIYEGTEELQNIPQAHLHWYGKQDCRPGRKMGHLTVVSPLDQIPVLKQRIRPWPSVRGKNPIQIPQ